MPCIDTIWWRWQSVFVSVLVLCSFRTRMLMDGGSSDPDCQLDHAGVNADPNEARGYSSDHDYVVAGSGEDNGCPGITAG